MKSLLFTLLSIWLSMPYAKSFKNNLVPNHNKIVFIFDKKKDLGEDVRSRFFILKNETIINYVDDNYQLQVIKPNHKYQKDTIILNTNQDWLHITHFYFSFEPRFQYRFQAGDTVHFSYENNFPIARVINREEEYFNLNFNFYVSQKLILDEVDFGLLPLRRMPGSDKENFLRDYFENLTLRQEILDSLNQTGKISNYFYNLHQISLELKFLSFLEECNLAEIQANKVLRVFSVDTEVLIMDSLLRYQPYRNYLIKYVTGELIGHDMISGPNSKIPNYMHAFNKIEHSELVYSVKEFLLLYCLDNIRENFSIQDFNAFHERFKNQCRDQHLVDYIKNNYLIDYDELRLVSSDVILTNSDKIKTNLSELLLQNKGKVIYIDFWASWCAPCREVMPYSRLMNERFKTEVVFIYLSIDTSFNKWLNANTEEKLQFYDKSYFVVNQKKSEFLKQLKFQLIPRYLLYNKKGELFSQNAPGPGDDNFVEVITGLLNNK